MGATAVSLLSGGPPLVSYALGALTAMVLVVTHPAHAVVSPGIARTTEQLVALNAVTGWILSIGLVLAPACAGLILAVSTPGAVYAAGAACVLLARSSCAAPRPRPAARARRGDARVGPLRQLDEGARALARASAPREVVIVLAATFLMVGAFDVLVVVLAVGSLGIGESGAGYLTAAHGAGAVLGAIASLCARRTRPHRAGDARCRRRRGAVRSSSSASRSRSLVAFAVAAVTGVSRSLLEVSGQTLLQRVTSTEILARVSSRSRKASPWPPGVSAPSPFRS